MEVIQLITTYSKRLMIIQLISVQYPEGFLLEIISNTQMKLRWEEVLLSVSF